MLPFHWIMQDTHRFGKTKKVIGVVGLKNKLRIRIVSQALVKLKK
jgi:hypothetical protein